MDERTRIKNEQLGNGIKGPTGLSWLFCRNSALASLKKFEIDNEEKIILQGLARRVKELSLLPIQEERRRRWNDHLKLKETEPLVFIDPESAWFEIIPHTSLKCHNDLARMWEFLLLKEIYWQENIRDDRVCRGEFSVQDIAWMSDFGITQKSTGGENFTAYHIEPVIEDYDRDLPKLKFRTLKRDKENSARVESMAHDVFDGILTVKKDNAWWFSAGLTVDFITLRGFENFLYDFYDYPDEMKALMAFLRDDWLNMLSTLETEGLLSLNNGGEFMGTGGYGWCDELTTEQDLIQSPSFTDQDDLNRPFTGLQAPVSRNVRPMDMWGYSESQESVSVSPDAFAEFVLPYQLPILEKFGLTSYGCCEPLDNRIDILMEKVPRLRKVTVSPWSDVNLMAEKLGKNYTMCWKMSAAYISTPEVAEETIRQKAREAIGASRKNGCPLEILNRDILTLSWHPENAARWVQLVREEARRF